MSSSNMTDFPIDPYSSIQSTVYNPNLDIYTQNRLLTQKLKPYHFFTYTQTYSLTVVYSYNDNSDFDPIS